MVHLRAMNEEEFTTFYAWLVEDYAREIARNSGRSLEETRAGAQQQMAKLLPDGLATAEQRLWMIVSDTGAEAVGHLWCHVDTARKRSFIYDIDVFETQQGRGYGSAALTALEELLRPEAITHIGLHVFGDNLRAQRLYTKLGYRITGINMQKSLADV